MFIEEVVMPKQSRLISLLAFCIILAAGLSGMACPASESDGEPVIACLTDVDCSSPLVCIEGTCQKEPEPLDRCETDIDCPAGQYCSEALRCKEIDYEEPPDGEDPIPACGAALRCLNINDCIGKGLTHHFCVEECCIDSGAGDGDEILDGDEIVDGDEPGDGDMTGDGDEESGEDCGLTGCPDRFDCNEGSGLCLPGQDHCDNTDCPDTFACESLTGMCLPSADNCSETGCQINYQCNLQSGHCEPDAGHCINSACNEYYECDDISGNCKASDEHCEVAGCPAKQSCDLESGVCTPDAEHCSESGCGANFDCNLQSGDCLPSASHCDNTGCSARFACDQETGNCRPGPDNCQVSGCDSNYDCNSQTGLCEVGATHCDVTNCGNGFTCNSVTGRCVPDAPSCTGACSGNDDQSCINDDFLCACQGSQLVVRDCEQYCYDEGYPSFDECYYYTNADTPSKNHFKCKCTNYGSFDGNCGSPIEITRFPYRHRWNIIGAMDALGGFGCEQIGTGTPGGSTPGDGKFERVYRFSALAGESFDIAVEAEDFSLATNPHITIRDDCSNSFTLCKHVDGTIPLSGDEQYTFIAPADGTYYLTVESANIILTYILTVDRN